MAAEDHSQSKLVTRDNKKTLVQTQELVALTEIYRVSTNINIILFLVCNLILTFSREQKKKFIRRK